MTDHAQRATELAGDCKTTDPRSVQWIMKELEDAYATGRREGLEEAAQDGESRLVVREPMPVMLDHIDWCRAKAKEAGQ